MGDPAGVGPEIIAKTFADPDFHARNRALVVGDAGMLKRAAELVGLPLGIRGIQEPEDAAFEPGTADVLQVGGLPPDLPFGELDARAGDAARSEEHTSELQ